MHHLYHFFGAHKSIWRFRLIIAAVVCAFFFAISFAFLTAIGMLRENIPIVNQRLFYGLTIVFSMLAILYFSYGYLVRSFSKTLTEKSIRQLSLGVLEHYKRQIDTCNLNRPITWIDLYRYMRYLEVTGKAEVNARCSKEVLRKQKSCIQELVQ